MGAMMGESAVPATATGRPGRAATTRGAAAPAHSLTPAGYEASELDATLRSHIAASEKNIRIAETLGPKIEEAVTTLIAVIKAATDYDGAIAQLEDLTRLHERFTKANLNLVKSTDELTRLRSFLAGGPDSRADLTVMGEIQLRALVFTAVKNLGLRVVNGDNIEVTA